MSFYEFFSKINMVLPLVSAIMLILIFARLGDLHDNIIKTIEKNNNKNEKNKESNDTPEK